MRIVWSIRRMNRRMCAGAALLLMMTACAVMGQVPKPTQGDVEQRVDKLLAKLTLDEKLEVLGGDRSFYIHALPSISMPAIKMSDGPYGVRTFGSSTAYA